MNAPSRKSTPFNGDERRSATVHAQAIAYNDPQTFPEVFLRHYTVGEVIGDGRFSAVFECRDKATGIQLALKIIDKTRCKGYVSLLRENK
jgi:serine/threonine protein kinase